MNHAKAPKFESISPFFAVSDVAAALTFYCESLGFDLGWKWGEPLTHANVCSGPISISLSLDSSTEAVGNVYVQMAGVEPYYSRLRDAGVEVGPLAERPYGMRDFLVVDPWGNRLVFGEPSVDASE